MNRSRRRLIYWVCQITGWTVYVCIGLVFVWLYAPGPPFWKFIIVYAAGGAIAIACTHVYRSFLQRRLWLALSPFRALIRVVPASFVVGTVIAALTSCTYLPVFGPRFFVANGLSWIFVALYAWIGSVFGWNVIYFGVHYFQQYRSAEFEQLRLSVVAKDAQFHALVSQLNPHFIFNCLNSIRARIGEDPEDAQTMITELSSILRYSLESGRRRTVSLADELEVVSAYLKLEAMRFEERLRVQIDATPAALSSFVPPMLLQTLVENGVKHGIASLPRGGEIRIEAKLNDGALHLQVINSGQLAPAKGSTRLGLENARERLRLLYGAEASVSVRNNGPQSVIAEVSLPSASAPQDES
jgi:sensor histidine kinase YesM